MVSRMIAPCQTFRSQVVNALFAVLAHRPLINRSIGSSSLVVARTMFRLPANPSQPGNAWTPTR